MGQYHSGELDQIVTIKRAATTSTGSGGQTRTGYDDIATDIWAHVHAISGGEREDHDRLESPSRYLFVIHYRSDFNESDVIEWNNVDYQIRFIKDRGTRENYLEIECEKGVTV